MPFQKTLNMKIMLNYNYNLGRVISFKDGGNRVKIYNLNNQTENYKFLNVYL